MKESFRKSCAAVVTVAALVAVGGSDAAAAQEPVKASSFGWNAADSTECLKKAFASGARHLVIDRQAGDWIVRPLFVTATNLEITVEDGVVLRAKKGEFKGKNDALLTIRRSRGVTLRGRGDARFFMPRADYDDPKEYRHAEWRHSVSILGGSGITVRDLLLEGSGGDGVYIRDNAEKVELRNLRCIGHYRQGISVISSVGLYVTNCVFNSTAGTAPQCGIDFEPNHRRDLLENILFEDCVFDGNASAGIDFYLANLDESTPPVSITMRRCTARGNRRRGISLTAQNRKSGHCRGEIRFENCAVSGNRGGAVSVRGLKKDLLVVSFSGCDFDARGSEVAGLVLSGIQPEFGGIRFENTRFLLDEGQDDIRLSMPEGFGVEQLYGKVAFRTPSKEYTVDMAEWAAAHRGDPELYEFRTAPFDAAAFQAAAPAGKTCSPVRTGLLRGAFSFVQAVPEAGEYRVRFRTKTLGRREKPAKSSFVLMDRVGTDLGTIEIPDGGFEYVLKAHGPQVFTFEVTVGKRTAMEVESTTPGFGLLADRQLHLFKGKNRELSFTVPAGKGRFRVQISPEEPVEVELVGPDGKVADAFRYGETGARSLFGRCGDGPARWTLRFPRVGEDFEFRLGAPAGPVVYPVR